MVRQSQRDTVPVFGFRQRRVRVKQYGAIAVICQRIRVMLFEGIDQPGLAMNV